MKKFIKILTALFIIIFSSASVAFAAGTGEGSSSCQTIYGGGQVCPPNVRFTINKMVEKPSKGGGFVNGLSINDAKFSPGQTITFQVTIKNTGSSKISNIRIVDALPQFLTFITGDGDFDQNNRTLSFTLNNLDPDKSQTFTIVAKVVDERSLPNNQGIICLENRVTATDSNNISASDSTPFCIAKAVVGLQVFEAPPLKQTPPTGPEALLLLTLIPSVIAGIILRAKSGHLASADQKKN